MKSPITIGRPSTTARTDSQSLHVKQEKSTFPPATPLLKANTKQESIDGLDSSGAPVTDKGTSRAGPTLKAETSPGSKLAIGNSTETRPLETLQERIEHSIRFKRLGLIPTQDFTRALDILDAQETTHLLALVAVMNRQVASGGSTETVGWALSQALFGTTQDPRHLSQLDRQAIREALRHASPEVHTLLVQSLAERWAKTDNFTGPFFDRGLAERHFQVLVSLLRDSAFSELQQSVVAALRPTVTAEQALEVSIGCAAEFLVDLEEVLGRPEWLVEAAVAAQAAYAAGDPQPVPSLLRRLEQLAQATPDLHDNGLESTKSLEAHSTTKTGGLTARGRQAFSGFTHRHHLLLTTEDDVYQGRFRGLENRGEDWVAHLEDDTGTSLAIPLSQIHDVDGAPGSSWAFEGSLLQQSPAAVVTEIVQAAEQRNAKRLDTLADTVLRTGKRPEAMARFYWYLAAAVDTGRLTARDASTVLARLKTPQIPGTTPRVPPHLDLAEALYNTLQSTPTPQFPALSLWRKMNIQGERWPLPQNAFDTVVAASEQEGRVPGAWIADALNALTTEADPTRRRAALRSIIRVWRQVCSSTTPSAKLSLRAARQLRDLLLEELQASNSANAAALNLEALQPLASHINVDHLEVLKRIAKKPAMHAQVERLLLAVRDQGAQETASKAGAMLAPQSQPASPVHTQSHRDASEIRAKVEERLRRLNMSLAPEQRRALEQRDPHFALRCLDNFLLYEAWPEDPGHAPAEPSHGAAYFLALLLSPAWPGSPESPAPLAQLARPTYRAEMEERYQHMLATLDRERQRLAGMEQDYRHSVSDLQDQASDGPSFLRRVSDFVQAPFAHTVTEQFIEAQSQKTLTLETRGQLLRGMRAAVGTETLRLDQARQALRVYDGIRGELEPGWENALIPVLAAQGRPFERLVPDPQALDASTLAALRWSRRGYPDPQVVAKALDLMRETQDPIAADLALQMLDNTEAVTTLMGAQMYFSEQYREIERLAQNPNATRFDDMVDAMQKRATNLRMLVSDWGLKTAMDTALPAMRRTLAALPTEHPAREALATRVEILSSFEEIVYGDSMPDANTRGVKVLSLLEHVSTMDRSTFKNWVQRDFPMLAAAVAGTLAASAAIPATLGTATPGAVGAIMAMAAKAGALTAGSLAGQSFAAGAAAVLKSANVNVGRSEGNPLVEFVEGNTTLAQAAGTTFAQFQQTYLYNLMFMGLGQVVAGTTRAGKEALLSKLFQSQHPALHTAARRLDNLMAKLTPQEQQMLTRNLFTEYREELTEEGIDEFLGRVDRRLEFLSVVFGGLRAGAQHRHALLARQPIVVGTGSEGAQVEAALGSLGGKVQSRTDTEVIFMLQGESVVIRMPIPEDGVVFPGRTLGQVLAAGGRLEAGVYQYQRPGRDAAILHIDDTGRSVVVEGNQEDGRTDLGAQLNRIGEFPPDSPVHRVQETRAPHVVAQGEDPTNHTPKQEALRDLQAQVEDALSSKTPAPEHADALNSEVPEQRADVPPLPTLRQLQRAMKRRRGHTPQVSHIERQLLESEQVKHKALQKAQAFLDDMRSHLAELVEHQEERKGFLDRQVQRLIQSHLQMLETLDTPEARNLLAQGLLTELEVWPYTSGALRIQFYKFATESLLHHNMPQIAAESAAAALQGEGPVGAGRVQELVKSIVESEASALAKGRVIEKAFEALGNPERRWGNIRYTMLGLAKLTTTLDDPTYARALLSQALGIVSRDLSDQQLPNSLRVLAEQTQNLDPHSARDFLDEVRTVALQLPATSDRASLLTHLLELRESVGTAAEQATSTTVENRRDLIRDTLRQSRFAPGNDAPATAVKTALHMIRTSRIAGQEATSALMDVLEQIEKLDRKERTAAYTEASAVAEEIGGPNGLEAVRLIYESALPSNSPTKRLKNSAHAAFVQRTLEAVQSLARDPTVHPEALEFLSAVRIRQPTFKGGDPAPALTAVARALGSLNQAAPDQITTFVEALRNQAEDVLALDKLSDDGVALLSALAYSTVGALSQYRVTESSQGAVDTLLELAAQTQSVQPAKARARVMNAVARSALHLQRADAREQILARLLHDAQPPEQGKPAVDLQNGELLTALARLATTTDSEAGLIEPVGQLVALAAQQGEPRVHARVLNALTPLLISFEREGGPADTNATLIKKLQDPSAGPYLLKMTRAAQQAGATALAQACADQLKTLATTHAPPAPLPRERALLWATTAHLETDAPGEAEKLFKEALFRMGKVSASEQIQALAHHVVITALKPSDENGRQAWLKDAFDTTLAVKKPERQAQLFHALAQSTASALRSKPQELERLWANLSDTIVDRRRGRDDIVAIATLIEPLLSSEQAEKVRTLKSQNGTTVALCEEVIKRAAEVDDGEAALRLVGGILTHGVNHLRPKEQALLYRTAFEALAERKRTLTTHQIKEFITRHVLAMGEHLGAQDLHTALSTLGPFIQQLPEVKDRRNIIVVPGLTTTLSVGSRSRRGLLPIQPVPEATVETLKTLAQAMVASEAHEGLGLQEALRGSVSLAKYFGLNSVGRKPSPSQVAQVWQTLQQSWDEVLADRPDAAEVRAEWLKQMIQAVPSEAGQETPYLKVLAPWLSLANLDPAQLDTMLQRFGSASFAPQHTASVARDLAPALVENAGNTESSTLQVQLWRVGKTNRVEDGVAIFDALISAALNTSNQHARDNTLDVATTWVGSNGIGDALAAPCRLRLVRAYQDLGEPEQAQVHFNAALQSLSNQGQRAWISAAPELVALATQGVPPDAGLKWLNNAFERASQTKSNMVENRTAAVRALARATVDTLAPRPDDLEALWHDALKSLRNDANTEDPDLELVTALLQPLVESSKAPLDRKMRMLLESRHHLLSWVDANSDQGNKKLTAREITATFAPLLQSLQPDVFTSVEQGQDLYERVMALRPDTPLSSAEQLLNDVADLNAPRTRSFLLQLLQERCADFSPSQEKALSMTEHLLKAAKNATTSSESVQALHDFFGVVEVSPHPVAMRLLMEAGDRIADLADLKEEQDRLWVRYARVLASTRPSRPSPPPKIEDLDAAEASESPEALTARLGAFLDAVEAFPASADFNVLQRALQLALKLQELNGGDTAGRLLERCGVARKELEGWHQAYKHLTTSLEAREEPLTDDGADAMLLALAVAPPGRNRDAFAEALLNQLTDAQLTMSRRQQFLASSRELGDLMAQATAQRMLNWVAGQPAPGTEALQDEVRQTLFQIAQGTLKRADTSDAVLDAVVASAHRFNPSMGPGILSQLALLTTGRPKTQANNERQRLFAWARTRFEARLTPTAPEDASAVLIGLTTALARDGFDGEQPLRDATLAWAHRLGGDTRDATLAGMARAALDMSKPDEQADLLLAALGNPDDSPGTRTMTVHAVLDVLAETALPSEAWSKVVQNIVEGEAAHKGSAANPDLALQIANRLRTLALSRVGSPTEALTELLLATAEGWADAAPDVSSEFFRVLGLFQGLRETPRDSSITSEINLTEAAPTSPVASQKPASSPSSALQAFQEDLAHALSRPQEALRLNGLEFAIHQAVARLGTEPTTHLPSLVASHLDTIAQQTPAEWRGLAMQLAQGLAQRGQYDGAVGVLLRLGDEVAQLEPSPVHDETLEAMITLTFELQDKAPNAHLLPKMIEAAGKISDVTTRQSLVDRLRMRSEPSSNAFSAWVLEVVTQEPQEALRKLREAETQNTETGTTWFGLPYPLAPQKGGYRGERRVAHLEALATVLSHATMNDARSASVDNLLGALGPLSVPRRLRVLRAMAPALLQANNAQRKLVWAALPDPEARLDLFQALARAERRDPNPGSINLWLSTFPVPGPRTAALLALGRATLPTDSDPLDSVRLSLTSVEEYLYEVKNPNELRSIAKQLAQLIGALPANKRLEGLEATWEAGLSHPDPKSRKLLAQALATETVVALQDNLNVLLGTLPQLWDLAGSYLNAPELGPMRRGFVEALRQAPEGQRDAALALLNELQQTLPENQRHGKEGADLRRATERVTAEWGLSRLFLEDWNSDDFWTPTQSEAYLNLLQEELPAFGANLLESYLAELTKRSAATDVSHLAAIDVLFRPELVEKIPDARRETFVLSLLPVLSRMNNPNDLHKNLLLATSTVVQNREQFSKAALNTLVQQLLQTRATLERAVRSGVEVQGDDPSRDRIVDQQLTSLSRIVDPALGTRLQEHLIQKAEAFTRQLQREPSVQAGQQKAARSKNTMQKLVEALKAATANNPDPGASELRRRVAHLKRIWNHPPFGQP